MNSFSESSSLATQAFPLACAPDIPQITDAKWLHLGRVIYEATEQVRERLKTDALWGEPVSLSPRGLPPKEGYANRARPVRAGFLPWPALLTMEPEVVGNICKVAGCTEDELRQFVIGICPYEHLPHIEQFFLNRRVMARLIKSISAAVHPMKLKQVRIDKGARHGGIKSARARQRLTKIPSAEVLLQESIKLLAAGKAESETAGILAQKYGASAQAIRHKRRQGAARLGEVSATLAAAGSGAKA